QLDLCEITRAGFPTAMWLAGTSLVTTAPAPITARSPIVTPFKIIERAPTKTPRPIATGFAVALHFSGSLSHPHSPAGKWKSLSNTIAPDPRIVPSPISIETMAHSTAPLSPTLRPSVNRAPDAIARRTDGWKQPTGLDRVELKSPTPSPSTIRPPLAMLM